MYSSQSPRYRTRAGSEDLYIPVSCELNERKYLASVAFVSVMESSPENKCFLICILQLVVVQILLCGLTVQIVLEINLKL